MSHISGQEACTENRHQRSAAGRRNNQVGEYLAGRPSPDRPPFIGPHLLQELLAQSGIEQMREPYACFLQSLPNDRGVRDNVGSIDLHFSRWVIAGSALSNAVLRSRLFRDGEGLVCPVHRRPAVQALDLGRRDRFHKVGGSFTRVFAHGLGYKTGIPGRMQVGGAAFSRHQDAVAASIVLE
jgi:hypothetical protein